MAKKFKKEFILHLVVVVAAAIVFIVALNVDNQPKPLSENEIEEALAKDSVAVTPQDSAKNKAQKKHKRATKPTTKSAKSATKPAKTSPERKHLDETIRE